MLLAKIIIHPSNIWTGKCLFTKWRSLFFIYLLFVLWTFCQKMVWLLVLSSLVTCLLDIAWILQVEVSCLLLLWVKGLIWIVFLARWDAAESTPVSCKTQVLYSCLVHNVWSLISSEPAYTVTLSWKIFYWPLHVIFLLTFLKTMFFVHRMISSTMHLGFRLYLVHLSVHKSIKYCTS